LSLCLRPGICYSAPNICSSPPSADDLDVVLQLDVRARLERDGRRAKITAPRSRSRVPVIRPPASRNVAVPLTSVLDVPVIRPLPSRTVLVLLASVVTVPMMRRRPLHEWALR
jgi:hypothetical protein